MYMLITIINLKIWAHLLVNINICYTLTFICYQRILMAPSFTIEHAITYANYMNILIN